MLESQNLSKIYISQKNWLLKQITEKEYFELHINLFRSQNSEWTIFFCNEDSKNIIPYMKDILNRKHKFIEIMYLKIISCAMVFLILLLIFNIYSTVKLWNNIKKLPTITNTTQQNSILPPIIKPL
jgi:hypothetical protein